jgi:hypothetical protein
MVIMKIVSISSYGTNPRYIIGAHRQYELAKYFYPDWEFRAYVDDASNYHMPDAKVIEVKDGSHGVFWRFEPLFESEENVVIVRDADGRITVREQMAVQEWLLSDKKFHVYRDHEAHFEFPVIACAFGYKGKLSETLHDIMIQFAQKTSYYTNDQVYLRDFVYKAVQHDMMVHSMLEGWFGETRNQLKNPYSFCGNGYDEHDMPLYPGTMQEMAGFNASKLDAKYRFDGGVI